MHRILLILLLLSFLKSGGQSVSFEKKIQDNFQYLVQLVPQEKLYLHTDKSAYTVGEKIWFSGYLVSATLNIPNTISNYIYTELVDRRDSVIQKVKSVFVDSIFYGNINLPQGLQQGEYVIRAYSYFMQNQGEEFLFKKKIRVINPQDSKVHTNVTYKINKVNDYTANIQLLDGYGQPYPRVTVSYFTNKKKKGDQPRLARTDTDGNFTVKIDSTIKYLELGFHEGQPFGFQRFVFVPKQFHDYDVQFFPEGGSLILGQRQKVAFKAIGVDGRSINISGSVFMDTTEIADVVTQHDGMGHFLLPVNPDVTFTAKIISDEGVEKIFDLPSISEVQWGVSVNIEDNELTYRVYKGPKAVKPDELYVLIQSRGVIYSITALPGVSRGVFKMEGMQEGIASIALIDGDMNVLSQRLFFVRENNRPLLEIKTNKAQYLARDLVEFDINFEQEFKDLEGRFSLSVTDDTKVEIDSLEDNIISNLLLTSDLKGYIENPAYYFNNITPEVDRHLDLVMMTHGWTRFSVENIAKGIPQPSPYPLEVGQVISGKVLTRFWGKNSKGASIALISNMGGFAATETDDEGNFLIDGLSFKDSTKFFIQALNAKGRKGVQVKIDQDTFLIPSYGLPYNKAVKEKEDEFYKKFGQDYYYDNGIKVYVLDEVTITRRKQKKTYSFYDNMAHHSIDSARIAELQPMDITIMVQELPGVMLDRDEEGEECFTRFGKKLYTLVNDFEEDMTYIRMIPPDALRSISLLDPMQGFMMFGERGSNGVLIISSDPFAPIKKLDPTHILSFSLLGYQIPKDFYVPKYEVDSIRRDNRYDERTTIYWNPNIKLRKGQPAKVSFYTADVYGTYSVILEGITRNGIICRKKMKLQLK